MIAFSLYLTAMEAWSYALIVSPQPWVHMTQTCNGFLSWEGGLILVFFLPPLAIMSTANYLKGNPESRKILGYFMDRYRQKL